MMKPAVIFILALSMAISSRDDCAAQQCTYGDCVNGTGTMTWKSGATYTGQWKNGVMDGDGTMTWKDGKTYRGQWKDGLFQGRGVLTWPGGEKYEGSFSAGKMEGAGTMKWKNGDRYAGQWKNGRMNGRGTMRHADGTAVRGTWKDGKAVTGKPADTVNSAMAGAWRVMCKCFPGIDSPYDCPSTSLVLKADGSGTFRERRNDGTISGTIRWTLRGSDLTISKFTLNRKPLGKPLVFTYKPAGKWYALKPAPYGPGQKVMSLCVIKKTGV